MNTTDLKSDGIATELLSDTEHNIARPEDESGEKDQNQCLIELGHWLAGLADFVGGSEAVSEDTDRNRISGYPEPRLVRSALVIVCDRAGELASISRKAKSAETFQRRFDIDLTPDEIQTFWDEVRRLLYVLEGLENSPQTEAWRSFRQMLDRFLSENETAERIIYSADAAASNALPDAVKIARSSGSVTLKWRFDLEEIISRIAVVMSYLRLVSRMMERDEPLKSSVILFSRIKELMDGMMVYINNRLRRFPDDSDALFGSLDAAAYTASIEMKKVQENELKGLVNIRPTPIVFARVETAFSLLNDSLQMTLVSLVQLIDKNRQPEEIFPNLLTKEQQSIRLRENMWHLLQMVKQGEQDPANCPVGDLKKELNSFKDMNLYYLFYKDMETVERFIEEVVITNEKKDLVPLLHRFGAYLETLLGQVNMRGVLAKHPFEALQAIPPDGN